MMVDGPPHFIEKVEDFCWAFGITSMNSLVLELESALQSGSSEKRVDTLRRVTSLFLDDADRLNEQQIRVFDDVLVHLIQRIETKALVQLSDSLAPVENAPIEAVRKLSRHDDITVAGPVLAKSNRLSDSDLIDIASSKSQAHLLAISGRASLSVGVTDVLVERGDAQVFHGLAKNSGAQFSESGFSALVKKAENDDNLAEKLGLRLDLPIKLLRELLAKATDLVRSRLLANASDGNREQIQRALASVANEVAREAAGPRDFARSDGVVAELNRHGKLNEAVLVGFVRERKYEETIATLALFCGVKSELVERLLKNPNYDALVVASKAAKLSWPTVALIMQNRFAHHSPAQEELNAAKSAFIALSQAAAQRSMRFMQVQASAKKAG